MTGRQVRAEEALRIGLADEVVTPEELHGRALALAAEVAAGALEAQRSIKVAIDDGLSVPLADGLRIEQAAFAEVVPLGRLADRCRQLPRARPRPRHLHRPLTATSAGPARRGQWSGTRASALGAEPSSPTSTTGRLRRPLRPRQPDAAGHEADHHQRAHRVRGHTARRLVQGAR